MAGAQVLLFVAAVAVVAVGVAAQQAEEVGRLFARAVVHLLRGCAVSTHRLTLPAAACLCLDRGCCDAAQPTAAPAVCEWLCGSFARPACY